MVTPAKTIPATLINHLHAIRGIVTYYLLVPHPTETRILVVPHGEGWALPGWADDGHDGEEFPQWHNMVNVERGMRERFGLDVAVLRGLPPQHTLGTDDFSFVYETEPAPADWTPPAGSRWVGYDDLGQFRLTGRGLPSVVGRWFGEADDQEALARRPPWYRVGWRDQALSWIDEQLARRGLTLLATPEQTRLRERSAEFRIQTSGGSLRFKAVPDAFAYEGPMMQELGRLAPGQVPEVLAYDASRRWMLLTDGSGSPLVEVPDPEQWADALRRYAELQIICIPRVKVFRSLGVPFRPVHDLAGQVNDLLQDSALYDAPRRFVPDQHGTLVETLSDHEIDRLRALAPSILGDIRTLARSTAVPLTLNHGNLAPHYFDGNVLSDWSDASITHPFFGTALMFMMGAEVLGSSGEVVSRLLDAYLRPWESYAPRQELERIFALVERLEPVRYAALYHRDRLPTMNDRWEKEWLLHYPLRLQLRIMPDPATGKRGRRLATVRVT